MQTNQLPRLSLSQHRVSPPSPLSTGKKEKQKKYRLCMCHFSGRLRLLRLSAVALIIFLLASCCSACGGGVGRVETVAEQTETEEGQ